MFKSLIALAAVACSLAFASVPAMAAGFNITDIVRASDADLDAGIADATAHADPLALQCYQGIKDYNATHPRAVVGVTKPVGAVSAFQIGRDVVKGVANTKELVPVEIKQACGALALDIQEDVAKSAVTIAGFRF